MSDDNMDYTDPGPRPGIAVPPRPAARECTCGEYAGTSVRYADCPVHSPRPAAPDATAGDGLDDEVATVVHTALNRLDGCRCGERGRLDCTHIADAVLALPALRDVLAAAARDAEKADVLADIADERARQDEKWGEQNHPDGTGGDNTRLFADMAKAMTDLAAREGTCTWRLILGEEVAEAFAETEPDALRGELVQVAAVAAQWIQAIDRRALDPS